MYRIKTMNKISPRGLALLDSSRFVVGDEQEKEHAILVRSAKLHDYAFPPETLAVARAGAGVNNIPLDPCAKEGIVVFNTPGANANAVKELALAALLLASRNITGGVQWAKEQALAGEDVAAVVEKGKAQFAGVEIMGKTLGVVGLGAIGILVANAAIKLGMNVVGYDPFLSVESALTLDPNVTMAKDLPKLYAAADFISLHLPMTAETKGSLSAAAFAQMKPGVRIINLARGELVNNADMKAALESGAVAAYATDFPDSEITTAKNVIPIPHLGASTEESEENCAIMAVQEIQNYLDNGNIVNSVNLPNLAMDWETPVRIAAIFSVVAKDNPDPVASVRDALAAEGITPAAMGSKIRGEYGYLIFDIPTPPSENALQALAATDGILRLRMLKK